MKKKADLNRLIGKPSSHSEKFHNLTKIKVLTRQQNPQYWPQEWKTIFHKGYSRLNEIILPRPALSNKISIKQTLKNRSSGRLFSSTLLTNNKLSNLLYYSTGLKNLTKGLEGGRFYPSAGGRYPIETYIVSLKVEDVPKGLYHYYVKNHSLEELLTFKKFNFKDYLNLKWVQKASILVILTSVFPRTIVKYSDRGYRHILTETGHIAQNFYLISTALNLSCCAIGGYLDDNFNKLLDIDGITESVIYVIAIGERA